LRHVLLLLLRTALIALIVLAAARPLVPAPAPATLRRAALQQRTALVVILDNSVSSGVVVDGRPMLDRLRAAARASLAAAGASDRLWLVLADGVARAGTREALLATLDSAGVSPRRLDLTAAVRDAARLVDAEPLEGREVHVMSDLQRTALGSGRAGVPRGGRVVAWRGAPPGGGPGSGGVGRCVAAALAVLEQGRRVRRGGDVVIGDRREGGAAVGVVVPPADPTLIGPLNRALAARGVRWRLGATGTPGPVAASGLREINGIQVTRRYRVEATGDGGRGTGEDSTVLATVNGEPWLVRDAGVLLVGSRLDTAWTALPAAPAFVPFVDALVNRLARGEAP